MNSLVSGRDAWRAELRRLLSERDRVGDVGRFVAGLILPYSLVQLRNRRWHERRANELRQLTERRADEGVAVSGFDYDDVVRFLVGRGLDEFEVRGGSIPPDSLEFLRERLESHLPTDRPLVGLHVGNFVGVSLAFVSSLLRGLHPDSVTVSIDPDVTHRAIERPASHVSALLAHLDLLDANLILPGYTLERDIGEPQDWSRAGDFADFTTALRSVLAEPSPQRVLPNLALIAPGSVDVALIDGNHDGEYLERELVELRKLLAPGGIVVVDDVQEGVWDGVAAAFQRVASGDSTEFAELARDARLGVLRFQPR